MQIDTDPAVRAKLQRGKETHHPKYFLEALDIDPDCYEARKLLAEHTLVDYYYEEYYAGGSVGWTRSSHITGGSLPVPYPASEKDKWDTAVGGYRNLYKYGNDFFDFLNRRGLTWKSEKRLTKNIGYLFDGYTIDMFMERLLQLRWLKDLTEEDQCELFKVAAKKLMEHRHKVDYVEEGLSRYILCLRELGMLNGKHYELFRQYVNALSDALKEHKASVKLNRI